PARYVRRLRDQVYGEVDVRGRLGLRLCRPLPFDGRGRARPRPEEAPGQAIAFGEDRLPPDELDPPSPHEEVHGLLTGGDRQIAGGHRAAPDDPDGADGRLTPGIPRVLRVAEHQRREGGDLSGEPDRAAERAGLVGRGHHDLIAAWQFRGWPDPV